MHPSISKAISRSFLVPPSERKAYLIGSVVTVTVNVGSCPVRSLKNLFLDNSAQ